MKLKHSEVLVFLMEENKGLTLDFVKVITDVKFTKVALWLRAGPEEGSVVRAAQQRPLPRTAPPPQAATLLPKSPHFAGLSDLVSWAEVTAGPGKVITNEEPHSLSSIDNN